jgi:hypothetical protein
VTAVDQYDSVSSVLFDVVTRLVDTVAVPVRCTHTPPETV